MSRAYVLDHFGRSIRRQELVKSVNTIWGPIEEFWSQIPVGAKVEIWAFQTIMTLKDDGSSYEQPGQTELYFINQSDVVNGVWFYIEGAVYEGT